MHAVLKLSLHSAALVHVWSAAGSLGLWDIGFPTKLSGCVLGNTTVIRRYVPGLLNDSALDYGSTEAGECG